MLIAFAFHARPGHEAELEALLNDPPMAERVGRGLGAVRNTLFMGRGRVVRILEFPEGVKPRSMAELAAADPQVADFLGRLGPLVEDGFDFDEPGSLDRFNARALMPLTFDLRLDVVAPSRAEM